MNGYTILRGMQHYVGKVRTMRNEIRTQRFMNALPADIRKDIGWDLSTTANYRPFETQNVILRASGAVLIPGDGFKDLFSSADADKVYYSVVLSAILAY